MINTYSGWQPCPSVASRPLRLELSFVPRPSFARNAPPMNPPATTTQQVGALCRALLASLGSGRVEWAFAYGSAAVPQAGVAAAPKMLDLVVVARDPASWHAANARANRHHYSALLRLLGPAGVARVQDRLPARVYFNTLCDATVDGREVQFKYGVTGAEALEEDLRAWRHLYLAGRLHKPILPVMEPNEKIKELIRDNLASALRASLLMLPEKFDERLLYKTITRLSYSGDFRMVFGENKKKVENIVEAQLPLFRDLYADPLEKLSNIVQRPSRGDDSFVQDVGPSARTKLIEQLPSYVIEKAGGLRGIPADRPGPAVDRALRRIVFESSALQSIKSAFTAGLLKSLVYGGRKIGKMLES